MAKKALAGTMAILALLGAACSSSNDGTGADSAPAAQSAPTPADEPVAAAESPQSATADNISSNLRAMMYSEMVNQSGVSEASAQCVVDTVTDEMIDAFIEFSESPPVDEPPEVVFQFLQVQNSCLTPEEQELMGFMPAGAG